MKPDTIVVTDQGIGCIEAPDSDSFGALEYREYNKVLEAAMKQAVLFKDHPNVHNQLADLLIEKQYEQGRLYPVPDEYEIKIEIHSIYNGKDNPSIEYAILVPKHVPVLHPTMGHELNPLTKIEFVPKQEPVKKDCSCTGPWDCQCQNVIDAYYGVEAEQEEKQPTSIEERNAKIKEYAKPLLDGYDEVADNILQANGLNEFSNLIEVWKNGFDHGRLSISAKEYWFEQFKQK